MSLIPNKTQHDVNVNIIPDYIGIGLIGVVVLVLMIINKKLL